MITRRTALGAGLAFASVAYAAGSKAYAQAAPLFGGGKAADVLLVDRTIELPRQLGAFLDSRMQKMPVVPVQLDAASHGELMKVLTRHDTIAGVTSGATLFCLERMAWDHGFRLTGRTQRCADDFQGDQCHRYVDAFLTDAHRPGANPAPAIRSYRASREDGALHAWVMQKYDGTRLRSRRQGA